MWACPQCISVEMKLRYLRERKQATGVTDARDFIRLEQELMSLANIKAGSRAQHIAANAAQHAHYAQYPRARSHKRPRRYKVLDLTQHVHETSRGTKIASAHLWAATAAQSS